jgi:hypothetical protein
MRGESRTVRIRRDRWEELLETERRWDYLEIRFRGVAPGLSFADLVDEWIENFEAGCAEILADREAARCERERRALELKGASS